jgi:hypothetical protein
VTVPGTLNVHGAKVQILDLPGIIEGAKDGKGRGRQVIAVARSCNLIFIVLDVLKPLGDKKIIEDELEGFGIRLNKTPPNILVKKKDKVRRLVCPHSHCAHAFEGGISIRSALRNPRCGSS